jgi:hypothetical protein
MIPGVIVLGECDIVSVVDFRMFAAFDWAHHGISKSILEEALCIFKNAWYAGSSL